MPLPTISKQRKIKVRKVLEENRRQANKVDNMFAQGFNIATNPNSVDFLRSAKQILAREPAIEATVVNIGTEAVGALRVVAIVEDFNNDATQTDFDDRVVGERVLSVRKPTVDDTGNIAVLAQALAADEVGKAYVGGTCLVEMQRWFDSPILNYADAEAGEDFALARIQGSLRILWEEVDESEELPIDLDHFAVVRFAYNYQTVPFKNTGSVALKDGGPATPNNATTGIDATDKQFSFEVAGVDNEATVYTVVGGDVPVGGTGRAVFAGLPFLALLNDNMGLVGDSYGTEASGAKYVRNKSGFRLIAKLGTHDGEEWGVLHYKSPFETTDFEGIASLDSAAPGATGAGSGVLSLDPASGDEEIVVIEFKTPLTRLNGWQVSLAHGADATVDQNDGTTTSEGLTSFGASAVVKPITSAFDFNTVTYGTRPSTTPAPTFTHQVSFVADEELFAVNADSNIQVGNVSSAGHFVQKTPGTSPTGLFFGLEITLAAVSVLNSGISALVGDGTVILAGFAFRL